MNKKKWVVLLTCVLLVSIVFWSVFKRSDNPKVEKPNFKVVLKESIYVEYGIDLNDPAPLLNIIESNVIDELESIIPSNAEYIFDIDNSKESYDFYERAKILGWDEEGKELFPGNFGVGDILGYHKMVGNSAEATKAITQKNEELGLEEIKPFKGEFTLKIGNYTEKFEFDYYVIEVFKN